MALINCPKCGKQISDKAEKCIHCGYQMKEQKVSKEKEKKGRGEKDKKKSKFFLILIVVLVLIAGGVTTVVIVSNSTREKKTEGRQQESSEADQKEQKKDHTHTFKEATCEEPKTCTECGATEGKPLGHTTEVGECKNCGKMQGKDIVEGILLRLETANGTYDIAFNTATSGTDYYSNFNSAANGFGQAKTQYEYAITDCGSYSELADLKRAIQDMKNALPSASGVSNDSESELDAYLDDMEDSAYKESYLQTEMINVGNKFGIAVTIN